jgi:hypothetical protein
VISRDFCIYLGKMRFFGNVRYFCEMNRGPPVLRSTRGWFPTKRLMYTWRVLSSVAGTSLPAEVWLFGKPAFPIIPPNLCVFPQNGRLAIQKRLRQNLRLTVFPNSEEYNLLGELFRISSVGAELVSWYRHAAMPYLASL